jgi:hypothetical protein
VLAYWTGLLFFFLVCTLRLLSCSYSYSPLGESDHREMVTRGVVA